MKSYVLDIETVPAETATLEKLMPPEIAAPVMPEEIAQPFRPNWAEKCPKYGGDQEKRVAWLTESKKKWLRGTDEARSKWHQSALDARARFVESAALHAESGHVKMIGWSVAGERTIYLWEPDRNVVDVLEKEAVSQKIALFLPFMREQQMFQRFAKDLIGLFADSYDKLQMGQTKASFQIEPAEQRVRLITYYGNTFDLPFLARRAAICGEPALLRFLRMNKRGRYLDSSRFTDLHEEWTMGDRETKTGGLDGLCKILGVEGKSAPSGGSFYKFYADNPAEGLVYLLRDLAATEGCAERMGLEL